VKVNLTLELTDAHVLRAILSQNNYPESWQARIIKQIDAAVEEATRDRYRTAPKTHYREPLSHRPASAARRTRPHEDAA
jgi:HEPN domain-containing protein